MPTCSETARKRQEASLAVILRYSPRLPRYSSIATSLKDFCPKYFFQPFCILPGRRGLGRRGQERGLCGGGCAWRQGARRQGTRLLLMRGRALRTHLRGPARHGPPRPPASPGPPPPGPAECGARPRLAPSPGELGPVTFACRLPQKVVASGAPAVRCRLQQPF